MRKINCVKFACFLIVLTTLITMTVSAAPYDYEDISYIDEHNCDYDHNGNILIFGLEALPQTDTIDDLISYLNENDIYNLEINNNSELTGVSSVSAVMHAKGSYLGIYLHHITHVDTIDIFRKFYAWKCVYHNDCMILEDTGEYTAYVCSSSTQEGCPWM